MRPPRGRTAHPEPDGDRPVSRRGRSGPQTTPAAVKRQHFPTLLHGQYLVEDRFTVADLLMTTELSVPYRSDRNRCPRSRHTGYVVRNGLHSRRRWRTGGFCRQGFGGQRLAQRDAIRLSHPQPRGSRAGSCGEQPASTYFTRRGWPGSNPPGLLGQHHDGQAGVEANEIGKLDVAVPIG